MKKILLITCLLFVNSSVYADQIDGFQGVQAPKSKLQRIQEKIDKYTKLINNLPSELQEKIDNFQRLKGLGNKIQEVLVTYIVATEECVKQSHSAIGTEACGDLSDLDLGSEIKSKKQEVMEMIEEAERELKVVQDKQKDIPMIEKILKTLQSTKQMMMNS
ncbi:MAG TPA: hypothetical protein ENK88_03635 [Campylobacterales bacterium]|nr:hypothetical protein [Campylobacterales bacterium]